MKNLFCIFNLANVSPANFQRLCTEVGSLSAVADLTPSDISRLSSLSKAKKDAIINAFERYEHLIHTLEKHQISYLTLLDGRYPKSLRQLADPPYILFFQGNLDLIDEFSIGIIGSRKPTSYGIFCADLFAKKLCEYKVTTLSGMANGIDGISQKTTVNCNGKTIAVLGSSHFDIYPKTNLTLSRDIVQNKGLILSEYSPFQPTLPHQFIARNRIIAALCQGLLVIEANFKSGTMTTVDFALELGKTVFAVPGNITSVNSNGTNLLIKNGAKITTNIEDLLEEFPFFSRSETETQEEGLSEHERAILSLLKRESPLYVELIAGRLKLQIQQVSATLNILEMKGLVSEIGNRCYVATT